VPPDDQVLAEAATAAVAAADLMTAWTSARLLSMMVEVPSEAEALSAGWAAARALGSRDASVGAEPVLGGYNL
jgi:hypothetical protein